MIPPLRRSFAIAAGGAVGAGLRWTIAQALTTEGRFPWATLAVNIAGCLVLGALVGAPPGLVAVLGVGLCGGLTTFSTWAIELRGLDDAPAIAVGYVGASLVGGVAAFWAGRRWRPAW